MDAKLTGKLISEKRKEKGLNQIQLGELLNVSNRTVSKWEKGDGYPDITLLPEIADCLGVTIDELLTGNAPAAPCVQENESINTKSHQISRINAYKQLSGLGESAWSRLASSPFFIAFNGDHSFFSPKRNTSLICNDEIVQQ